MKAAHALKAIPVLLLLGAAHCARSPAGAADANDGPRFVALKQNKVYMREGPSTQNRVKWVYHRKGLPMEVLSSYEVWRRVKDMDGVVGWIHTAMLSRERTALVTGKDIASLYDSAKPGHTLVAHVQPGAIGRLERCDTTACEIKFGKVEGWINRARLWGVQPEEKF